MATGSCEVDSPNTELSEDVLYNTLYRVRRNYASLGIQIGLKKSEIDDIEAQKLDPGKSLLEVLSIGLNKAKPLTWNGIYSALRSECVNESRLAERIRQKYGHLFIPTTESESDQEHEIKSEEIKKSTPKKQKGDDHRARVSKKRERRSEYEGLERVRSKKHVEEMESEDEEVRREELSSKLRRKGAECAHYKETQVHEVWPKGMNKKDESHSEPEEVVRENSRRRKKATHRKKESVKRYCDQDHYSDSEVCEKELKKHSTKREVNTESESEASSDEEEMESARKTKHTEVKLSYPQMECREEKYCDIQYSDEGVSTGAAQKLRRSEKISDDEDSESEEASDSEMNSEGGMLETETLELPLTKHAKAAKSKCYIYEKLSVHNPKRLKVEETQSSHDQSKIVYVKGRKGKSPRNNPKIRSVQSEKAKVPCSGNKKIALHKQKITGT